jgi:PilZ domain
VATRNPGKNARKWTRLHLSIPVFIRSRDENGRDSLEFATAINISAGGALVVVRRSLPKLTRVSLEVPSAPIGTTEGTPAGSKVIHAKAVWVGHQNDYHLLGLKFNRPLSTDMSQSKAIRKTRLAV